MASGIQTLSIDLVHRIAAGEVIDSLAAVVRELIENALDAGARRIVISLWPEEWRVRVADNGCGLSLADLKQAAAPHTTSKIHSTGDLWRISTLGFRGEALHSLAQVASLEIYSRPAGADAGGRAIYDAQGQVAQLETIAIAPGTVVTVSHLFAAWPSRRCALPPLVQQMRFVQNVIYQSALCHPTVTWQVQQNNRPWFSIAPGKTAQEILPQLLSSVRPGDLQGLSREVSQAEINASIQGRAGKADYTVPTVEARSAVPRQNQIELVVGLPERCHRRRPDWVRVAVNGRCVSVSGDSGQPAGNGLRSLPELEQAILSAFRQMLPRHRYPLCFVHLRVAPEQIDWNRHPAKIEIYLHHLGFWQEQITQAIQQALQISGKPLNGSQAEQVRKLIKAAESEGFYRLNRSVSTSLMANPQDSRTDEPALSQLRAVAQIHNTYILAEHPAGLWLVEQHIAHERVLYEQLCQDWQIVELNPPAMLTNLAIAQVEQLQQLGIAIEAFGNNLWAVRSCPKILAQRDDCADALLELSLGDNLQTALVATACRSAIRNGTPLSLKEMQKLLEQWQRTRHPRTCPHGRPIYLTLTESDLARFFRRHWVIGKSHGI
jgi:DNA mismatch repair protein MutL